MIASIRLRNVGPVEEMIADIDPRGHVTFSGPSMAGKTSATRAMLGLWTGETPEVRDGAEKAETSVVTGGGTALTTTVTPSGSWTRTVQKKGEPKATRHGSHAEFATWTGAAAHPDLVRVIAFPRAWEALYTSELGRPFRDLLMRVLPPADLQARIRAKMAEAGLEVSGSDLAVAIKAGTGASARFVPLPASDPDYPMLLVKKLRAAQTEANTVLRTAEALLLAGLQRLEKAKAEKVDAPTKDAVDAADRTIAANRAWETYDVAHRAWKLADDARAAKETEREHWRARKAALGDRPVVDAEARQSARVKVETLTAKVDKLRQEEVAAKAREEAEAKAEAQRAADAERAAEASRLAEARRLEDEARHARELEEVRLMAAQTPVGASLPMFGGGSSGGAAPRGTSSTPASASPVAVAAARLAERAEYVVGKDPEDDCTDDYERRNAVIRRTSTGDETVLGTDGGEPEDRYLFRDWAWVAPALQAVEDRANEDRAALLAEIQRLTAEVARLSPTRVPR